MYGGIKFGRRVACCTLLADHSTITPLQNDPVVPDYQAQDNAMMLYTVHDIRLIFAMNSLSSSGVFLMSKNNIVPLGYNKQCSPGWRKALYRLALTWD